MCYILFKIQKALRKLCKKINCKRCGECGDVGLSEAELKLYAEKEQEFYDDVEKYYTTLK